MNDSTQRSGACILFLLLLSTDGARSAQTAGSPCDSLGWHAPPPLDLAVGPGVRVRVTVGSPQPDNCWNPVRIERRRGSRVEPLATILAGQATAQTFRARGARFFFIHATELSATHEFHSAYLYRARRDGTIEPVALEPGAACGGRELPELTEAIQSDGYSLVGTMLQYDSPIWRTGEKPNFPSGGRERVRLGLVHTKTGFALRVVACKEDHRR
jgi:hypothetical protein